MDLGSKRTKAFLDQVWEGEWQFLQEEYRQNVQKLIVEVSHRLTYLRNKETIDAELPAIHQDALASGTNFTSSVYVDDVLPLDLFFKSIRLWILYGGKKYVNTTRRKLIAQYGCRRMSLALSEHFEHCIQFYRLQPYNRNHEKCKIEDMKMDETIIFRVL